MSRAQRRRDQRARTKHFQKFGSSVAIESEPKVGDFVTIRGELKVVDRVYGSDRQILVRPATRFETFKVWMKGLKLWLTT